MTTTRKQIITFSGRMRSGKDMLCNAMKTTYGSKTFSLATHLKCLCCGILDTELPFLAPWDVEKLNFWKNNRGVLCKEGIPLSASSLNVISEYTGFEIEDINEKCDGWGFRSVRELIQHIGTDVIRSIEPDWHIRKTLQDISKLPDGAIACVDDIRFKNELEAFRNTGADSFFITRNNAEILSKHDSENGLTHLDFPDDKVIVNNKTIDGLCNEFVSEYANDFQIVSEHEIFLSELPEYRDVDRHFGLEWTPIVEEVIRQNRDREQFVKDGFITFRNNTKFKLKELLEEMKIEHSYSYSQVGGRFVIDNPIAYENLKKWL